jgi:hypothetical protein
MAGIIEHIQSAVGGESAKIAEFIHETFHDRLSSHGHFGRAAVETVAETCRKHPAAIGLATGLLVDRLLVEEERRHEAKLVAGEGETPAAANDRPKAKKAKAKHAPLRLTQMKPGRVAFEVFGGLMLLKIAASGARIFRHKHQDEVWFAPAAKIHLLSGTLCAYNLTKALRSRNISAWRNGAILLFGTDAIKPVLKWYKAHPPAAPKEEPAEAQPAPAAEATPAPAPTHTAAPFSHDAVASAAPAISYAELFSHGAADFGPIRLEAAPDPALALAQAFAGMMAPGRPAPGGPPNLQIVK